MCLDHGLAAAVDLDQLRYAIVTDHLFFVRAWVRVGDGNSNTPPLNSCNARFHLIFYVFEHLVSTFGRPIINGVIKKTTHLKEICDLSPDGMTRLVWMLNDNCKSFKCSSHSSWNSNQFVFSVHHVECGFKLYGNNFALFYRLHLGKCEVMKKNQILINSIQSFRIANWHG